MPGYNNDFEDSMDLALSDGDRTDKSDRLVFPINIHESIAAAGSMKKSEKAGILISFWLFACAILAWFLLSWLRTVTPQYYIWLVIGIELLLQLTVGTFLLRFILDERTMFSEMENADNSFAKYFGIYHEVISHDGSTYPFDIIEFNDGSYGVYLQLLMGYNTDQASKNTYDANLEIQRLINKSGMTHKVIYCNEKFSNSSAADSLRNVVAGVKDPRLFTAYRDIVQGLLKTANEQSNVLCTTYVIYAKTRIQKEELTKLVNNIVSTITAEDTAYREVATLSYHDIVEFYRNYYKLDVLDMGLIRVHTVQKKRIACTVKLLKVYGKSGKVYTTQDWTKLRANILDDVGLQQANKR